LGIAGQSGSQTFLPIRQLLIDDGLITPGLLETCTAMLNAKKKIPYGRIIHSFGQLFQVDFGSSHFYFFMLSMNQLQFHDYAIFCEQRLGRSRIHMCARTAPYLGKYQCCIFHANTA